FPTRRSSDLSHVLDDDHLRAEGVDSSDHLIPEARAGPLGHPEASTGGGDVLARETAGQDIDGRNRRPVDLRDVAEVRRVGEALGEDPRRHLLELRDPHHLSAVHGLRREAESSISSEEFADPRLTIHVGLLLYGPGSSRLSGRSYLVIPS